MMVAVTRGHWRGTLTSKCRAASCHMAPASGPLGTKEKHSFGLYLALCGTPPDPRIQVQAHGGQAEVMRTC